jgi:P2-related tail formation protein
MNDAGMSHEWEKLQKGIVRLETQLRQQVCTELEPFLEKVRCLGKNNERFKLFRKAFLEYKKRHDTAAKIFVPLLKVTSLGEFDLSAESRLLFLYLGAIESIGNACVDILVLLLVASGKDFHVECRYTTPRVKHLSSINELKRERVSLGTKVNFLRDNGMERISSHIDSKLRNDIAHLNISIKENEIEIRGEPAHPKTFLALMRLEWTVSAVRSSLESLNHDIGIVKEEGVES